MTEVRCPHCGYDSRYRNQAGEIDCAVCLDGKERPQEIAPGVPSACPNCCKRTRYMDDFGRVQCWYCDEQAVLLGIYSPG